MKNNAVIEKISKAIEAAQALPDDPSARVVQKSVGQLMGFCERATEQAGISAEIDRPVRLYKLLSALSEVQHHAAMMDAALSLDDSYGETRACVEEGVDAFMDYMKKFMNKGPLVVWESGTQETIN